MSIFLITMKSISSIWLVIKFIVIKGKQQHLTVAAGSGYRKNLSFSIKQKDLSNLTFY
ncbi:MAG: hypothetical protein ACJ0E5_03155 [Gammaproteobacteria bacterium]